MIRYNPKSWSLLLMVKGALIRKLMPGMLIIASISSVLCYLHMKEKIPFLVISNSLPGYMGAALGLLLVFRNNTAYEKWWEARKEVGALVNVSRNIAITLNGFLPKENAEKFKVAHLVASFAFTMKGHLRNKVKMEEVHILEHEDYAIVEKALHKPAAIANIIMSKIEDLWKNKHISDMQQIVLVNQVTTMVDVVGRCERIKNTPIPIAYAFLLKFFIVLYVMILPFGLLDELQWWSVPLSIILYYIMMSIVLTAEEIEDPFGKDLNDLPMDEIASNIRKNVMELVKYE
ncbi:MAG TPA: bestrophin family protein [Cytophagaceae bacterium]|jgi:putative membrane protein|nr:bestrophin family protein [Cytophagaceae bacterium]